VTEFDKVIPPGGSGKVTAQIHTTNFKGPVTKSVNVTTNDPDNAHFTLQIKANIVVPLDVQPSENVAFNGKADQLAPQELTVSSTSKAPFDITAVTPADANFKATVVADPETGTAPKTKSGTVASGVSRYKVTITPGKDLAVGRINSSIVLKTTLPKAEEQVIRIFGTVTGDVEVTPQYVTLAMGPNAAPEAKVQHVTVRKTTGDPLKVTSVTSDNPSLTTSLKTVAEGREYDVEVKYTGEPMTTPLTAKVTIKTNDPKQSSIEVQVWGRVDAAPHPMANMGTQGPVTIKPVPVNPTPPTP
jgi:hypothetical protein